MAKKLVKKEKRLITAISLRAEVLNEFNQISGYGSRSKKIENLLIEFINKEKGSGQPNSPQVGDKPDD